MLKSLKLPSALIMSLFCFAPLVQADEQLLDGVHPFICDGEAAVLLQTDNGWASIGEPNIEVSELRNGWRFGDQGMGFIGYLKEYEQDEWTLEFLSDGGYERVSCIDLTESVSEVVTAIKPRLGEAIVETQEALAEATRNLRMAEQNKERLLEDHKTELGQTQEVHRNELLRLQQEKLRLETAIEAVNDEYSALRIAAVAAVKGSSGAPILRDLLEMDPGERNEKINDSNLVQALNRNGILPPCVKTLRDKAKLSEQCEEAILDFLLIEGWDLDGLQ